MGIRTVHLWLTALPMSADKEVISIDFCDDIRPILPDSIRYPRYKASSRYRRSDERARAFQPASAESRMSISIVRSTISLSPVC